MAFLKKRDHISDLEITRSRALKFAGTSNLGHQIPDGFQKVTVTNENSFELYDNILTTVTDF